MLRRRSTKGQSSVEYTIILIIVLAALLAMQNYFKRGLQGRWRSAIDEVGEQYDPRTVVGAVQHTTLSNSYTVLNAIPFGNGFQTTRIDFSNSIERKTGSMSVGGY